MNDNKDQSSSVNSNSYDGELNQDIRNYRLPKNTWTHARNAVTFSGSGDMFTLENEPSNFLCAVAPYTIIGNIYLYGNTWAVFSTNDTDSEIGMFVQETCTYTKVVNDPCLNFNRANLISGVSKKNADCAYHIYWADKGRNPDRTMSMSDVPYIENCVTVNGCVTCTPTTQLDCDQLRLAPLVDQPCIKVKKGASGGSLLNGSYFATAAYLIDGQKITDYFTPSNVQPLFEHQNVAGSIDITLTGLDQRFDEYELVVVSVINQQTQAKRIGVYSTRQSVVSLDIIDNKLIDVPIELIPLQNPVVESSDAIYEVNDYMLRVGPRDKFDFNYQILASQIVTKWQSVEYPADYYRKGGSNPSFLRDENYALFIEWSYDDQDWSSSYHIPGRASFASDFNLVLGNDADIEVSEGIQPYRWRVENTATLSALYPPATLAPDGQGVLLSEGLMGYWESSELYPDNTPAIWGTLCGKPIRHHKFPEQQLHPSVAHFTNSSPTFGHAIRIMAVKFENIQVPVDNAGNPITNLKYYRILRGSREGNKTIVAKGMINNMFSYAIEGGITPRTGLYPNYPYNDLQPDYFLSTADTSYSGGAVLNHVAPSSYLQDTFTFHSPDTQFKNPFLSMNELKVYGEMQGNTEGQFVEPDGHSKHKLLTDFAFVISIIAGTGIAMIAMNGDRRTTTILPKKIGFEDSGLVGGASTGTFGWLNPVTIAMDTAGTAASGVLTTAVDALTFGNYDAGLQFGLNLAGQSTLAYYTAISAAGLTASAVPGMVGYSTQIDQTAGKFDNIPFLLRTPLTSLPTFINFMSEGSDATLRLIKAFVPFQQYALQYQSHCFYDGWTPNNAGRRRLISDEIYLDNQIQDFGTNFRINNLFRGRSVAVQTTVALPVPSSTEQSRFTVGQRGIWSDPTVPFLGYATSFYTALKNRLQNQYGQIGGVQQVPFDCINEVTITSGVNLPITSPVLFGGDTYVTRYTEKNTFFYFYDWLRGQPDGFEFNYHLKKMLPYPAFWMDTREVDIPEFLKSVTTNLFAPALWAVPSHQRVLDRNSVGNVFGSGNNFFVVKDAYMYLFNSGVRDFYVESEVNTDLRDWGDNDEQRHYDPYRYTDVKALFNSAIIKSGNYFKYDYSLSISRLFTNFISWANVQPINYDPVLYEFCYTYRPNKVIYSLPKQDELIRDNWRIFLPNNYRNFKSRVTTVKPIGANGAIIFFETEGPVQFLGVESFSADSGTKITIGDGELFSQPMQNIMDAEKAYEHGACQSRLSVVNTPAGLFWISQSQGKIFQLAGGLKEITIDGLNWWTTQYIPYRLTEQFPTFELTDNPVIGIGCQSMFDNENVLVYFTKRDYIVRTDIPDVVTYVSGNDFLVNGMLPIKLGDPDYFEDASWTVSFNPWSKGWVSFHDWHPELMLPGKNTFLSIVTNAVTGEGGIWVHNELCNSYCNFYGKNFPFEVEYQVNTVQQINTLRSVEAIVETYIYAPNCHDRYLSLEEFFDEAVVFNQEQVSGLLRLNVTPHNDPYSILDYPIINTSSIDILYSKVENKYRFNQIFDVVDDRGEYTNARRVIWNTGANGYVKVLNPLNLNYAKNELQLKKMRGYVNNVFLRRKVSGNLKMIVQITNNKNLNSPS